jgi:hypothetical protein
MRPFRHSLGGLLLFIAAWGYLLAFPLLRGVIAAIAGVVVLLALLMTMQLPVFLLLRATAGLPAKAETPRGGC